MARPKKIEKANITWLGEDDLHEDGYGPSKNVWNGITFMKGVAVEVTMPDMIAKAKANPFYSVEGYDKADAEAEAE